MNAFRNFSSLIRSSSFALIFYGILLIQPMFLFAQVQGTISVRATCPELIPQNRDFTGVISVDLTEAAPARLGSFTAVVEWDPNILGFTGDARLLSNYNGVINDSDASSGRILFNGVLVEGNEGVFDIFAASFRPLGPVGAEGTLRVSFSSASAAISFENLLPLIQVEDCDFSVGDPVNINVFVDAPQDIPAGCDFLARIGVDLSELPDVRLGSFTLTLTWDPDVLQLTGEAEILNDYEGVINTSQIDAGILRFNGVKVNGLTGIFNVFLARFLVIADEGATGSLQVTASALAASFTFEDLLPFVLVSNLDFEIQPPDLLGDVNGDDLVNSTDALIILTSEAGLEIEERFQLRLAEGLGDVNADGLTNSTDALIILTFNAELPVDLPVAKVKCPR